MYRFVACALCVFLLCGFVEGPPITGKWSACGNVKIGDPRIELSRNYLFPCADQGYKWTEMKFDTAKGGRMEFGWCATGPIPTGTTMIFLCSSCSSRYGKWNYDASTSTLTLTDSVTVSYLVSSITDSSMVLIKK